MSSWSSGRRNGKSCQGDTLYLFLFPLVSSTAEGSNTYKPNKLNGVVAFWYFFFYLSNFLMYSFLLDKCAAGILG